MGAVAVGALLEPLHNVEALGARFGELVAVEGVDDQAQVAVGGILVGQELGVLPDAEDVRDVEDGSVLVGLLGGRRCQVAVMLAANLDELAGGGTSIGIEVSARKIPDLRTMGSSTRLRQRRVCAQACEVVAAPGASLIERAAEVEGEALTRA